MRRGPVTLYLALPTDLVAAAVTVLESLPRYPQLRIAVEKPFGSDLASAQALNAALLRAVTTEDHLFRIDHVLGMPAVQELPSTISGVLASAAGTHWRVTDVSILWEETLALEGRASFYDGAGALKDLLQNHLLQLMCMIIMTRGPDSDVEDVANRRRAALHTVAIPTIEQATSDSRRGRYTAGRLSTTGGADGADVPDYAAEPGVDSRRNTETLAEVAFRVRTPEWAGARFVLRAGKALAERRRGVLVELQGSGPADRRQVWIDVDEPTPDHAATTVESSGPVFTTGIFTTGVPMEQIAYANVLRCLLSGSYALSVSADEAETAWQLFTPVLQAWASGRVPLQEYPAGTTPWP